MLWQLVVQPLGEGLAVRQAGQDVVAGGRGDRVALVAELARFDFAHDEQRAARARRTDRGVEQRHAVAPVELDLGLARVAAADRDRTELGQPALGRVGQPVVDELADEVGGVWHRRQLARGHDLDDLALRVDEEREVGVRVVDVAALRGVLAPAAQELELAQRVPRAVGDGDRHDRLWHDFAGAGRHRGDHVGLGARPGEDKERDGGGQRPAAHGLHGRDRGLAEIEIDEHEVRCLLADAGVEVLGAVLQHEAEALVTEGSLERRDEGRVCAQHEDGGDRLLDGFRCRAGGGPCRSGVRLGGDRNHVQFRACHARTTSLLRRAGGVQPTAPATRLGATVGRPRGDNGQGDIMARPVCELVGWSARPASGHGSALSFGGRCRLATGAGLRARSGS